MSSKPFVCPITNVIIPPLEEMQARLMQPLKPTNLSQISDKVASSKTEEEIRAEKKRILMLKFCRTKYVKDNNAEGDEELDAPDITDSHLIGCDEFGKFIGRSGGRRIFMMRKLRRSQRDFGSEFLA
ncbi:hypothetical protein ABKN59_011292 [Abortiporus biennis]